jgi:hypothetical protein
MKVVNIMILIKIVMIITVLIIYNNIYQKMAESHIKDLLIIDINLKFLPFLILSLIEFYVRNKTRILFILLGCNIVLLVFSHFALDYINYPIIFFDVILCLLLILLNNANKKKIMQNPSY